MDIKKHESKKDIATSYITQTAYDFYDCIKVTKNINNHIDIMMCDEE